MFLGKERVISGFRPTSDLTVGNFLGAIKPALEIQEDPSKDLFVFVADLHGLTDHDPREILPYRQEVIHDCLALGIDPSKTTLYLQTETEAPVTQIANRLSPYISVAELARTPNLKEKMQAAVRKGAEDSEDSMRANLGLLSYPVLMAADIFAQRASRVAVGEDQEPHLELSRTLARRFNNRFEAPVLQEPTIFALEALRIVSLDGKGKMSKTNPSQAIILTDDPRVARKKIQKATTASAGEWNPTLESHFLVASRIAHSAEVLQHLESLREEHMSGGAVMGEFKKTWADTTEVLLDDFQSKKRQVTDEEIGDVLKEGGRRARENAQEVLQEMRDKMLF